MEQSSPVERAPKLRMRNWLPVAALMAASAMAGCVPDAPPRVELADNVQVPQRCGLVFWVDGLDIEHFRRLGQAGKLPNITRYLIDRGVTVRNAVASFPTITYANNVSFNTGLFPGHHGIVGNKWFDRYSLVFQDYASMKTYQQVNSDFQAKTIHEALGDEFTATILTPVSRGTTRNIDNQITVTSSWFFGMQKNINHLTTARFELIADLANRTGRWPKFILAYFVTPDTLGHARGPSSDGYTEMILDTDRQIGHVCRSLEAAGILERTYVTLVVDHGFIDTPDHFDVAAYFAKELKIPTISRLYGREVMFESRLNHFNKARAVVVAGGNRRCAIHLRHGDHWWQRPTPEQIKSFEQNHSTKYGKGVRVWFGPPADLPATLAGLPAVDLVVVRLGDDSVRVHRKDGVGVIERTLAGGRKEYRYRITNGTDPLGYASDPKASALMDGGYHDSAAWLAATLNTPRPDCVVQLAELNDSPRSGDIALFAADGWDFTGSDRGGHGGLLRREIVVPWIWAGPGLPPKATLEGARTVDLMPTMLHLIGRGDAVGPGLDGQSRAEALKQAR